MKKFKIWNFKREFALISGFIMITVAFNSMLQLADAEYSGTQPPTTGDWIIHNETYVGNETIIMNGDVIICETGKLTLYNCILKMNCSSNGDYKIQVNSSGELNLYYTMITNGSSNVNYDFYFFEGSNGDIQYSTIEKCGYNSGGSKGLKIESFNVSIHETTLKNNYNGVYAIKASPLIINSTIKDNTNYGIYWDSGVQLFRDNFDDNSKIETSNNIQIDDGNASLNYDEYFPDENTTALIHLDDGSGNTATDSSGNGNDGSITGASWSTNSRFGSYALSFDGNDDYVDFGDVFDLSSGSIEMWFNLTENFNSTTSSDMILFSKYNTQGPKEYSVKLKFESDDGKIHFIIINDADSKDIYSDSAYWVNNNWYHVAATWGSTGMKMYVNNTVQQDTDPYTGYWGDKNSNAFVGILYDGSSYTEDFDGIIDEFRVSQIARTSFIGYSTLGNLISKLIYPDSFIKWQILNITKTEPDENHYIRIDILNGETKEVINGFENLFGAEIDISAIQWYDYTSLKLKAKFYGDGNKTPKLDNWHLEGTTTIYNNVIQNNNIGIYLIDTSPIISENIIKNNSILGIKIINASPQIENNDISSTDKNGDGIYYEDSYPHLINNTIHHCNNGVTIKNSFAFNDAESLTNNSLYGKNPDRNLTFTEGQPPAFSEEKITYIKVPNPKYSTISNATLNLQGFLVENFTGIGWGASDTKISVNSTYGRTAITAEGENIYVVWEENSNIYFNKYNGVTWDSTNERVNNNQGTAISPAIAVDNNNVFVIWEDDRNGDSDIYFNKYTSGSWGNSDARVNTDLGNAEQLEPAIAADNGYVYAVWEDNRKGVNDYDIYFNVYDGDFWGPVDIKISNDPGTYYQSSPSIAALVDNLYVVWEDNRSGSYDIYFNMYNGGAWGDSDIEVSNDPGSNDQTQPSIAVENANRYVVWQDKRNGNLDIYFNQYESGDWGASDIKISNDAGYNPQNASLAKSIAVDNGNISVVWLDYRNDQGDIYFNTYNGSSWDTTDFKINNEGESQGNVQKYPAVAMSNDDIFIVWTELGNGTYFNDYRVNKSRLVKANPTNPYLDVGNDGDIQWFHSGIFDATEQETTENFASELNTYLQNIGNDPNQYVSVPLVFHSNTGGGLNISNIEIIYNLDLPIMVFNTLSYCNISLNLNDTSTLMTYQNIFESNNISIKCYNSKVSFEDSEISNSMFYDFYLINTSNSTVINTNYNEDKLFFNDTSKLMVKWYLHIELVDNNDDPVEGKIVSVVDKFNGNPKIKLTNNEGWAKWILLTEVAINKSDRMYYTPHRITIIDFMGETQGINNINLVMDTSREVKLYYGKDSDLDGYIDNVESSDNILWFEAEHYVKSNDQIYGNIVTHPDGTKEIINEFFPLNGNGTYKYYIRARTNMENYITDVDSTNPNLYDISWHPNNNYALLVGDSGLVAQLENGTLNEISSHTAGCLYGVDWKSDGSEALMVGWNMTFKNENPSEKAVILKYDGTKISEISNNCNDPLNDVAWHPTSDYAIIVGNNGRILKYQNGIITSYISNVSEDLNGIAWKLNGSYALIIGDDGRALKYYNSTGGWSSYTTGTQLNLFGVTWLNNNEVFIVGDEGKLLKYNEINFIDIGQSETKKNLKDICYNSLDDEVIIVGENGTVLTYNNSIFNLFPTPINNDYYGIAWKPNSYTTIILGSCRYSNNIFDLKNETYGIVMRYFVPRLNLSVNDSSSFLINKNIHKLNNEFRWYSTQEFTTESEYLKLLAYDLENDWVSVEVDKIMLARFKNITGSLTDIKSGQITNALDYDTDNDGIKDGLEVRNGTYWWEGEDHVNYNNSQIVDDVFARNSKAIISINDTINETFNISVELSNISEYKYYVKAKKIPHIYDNFSKNNVGNNGDQLWTVDGDYEINDGNLDISYYGSPGSYQHVYTKLQTTKKYTTTSNWDLDFNIKDIILSSFRTYSDNYGISIFLTDDSPSNNVKYIMGNLSNADDVFQEIKNWYSIRVECNGLYARFYRADINGTYLLRKIVDLENFNGIYFGIQVDFYYAGGVFEGFKVLFDNVKVSDGEIELFFNSDSLGTFTVNEQYEWYSKEITVAFSTGTHNLFAQDISVDVPSIYIDKIMLVNISQIHIISFSDDTESKEVTFPSGGGYNNSITLSIPENSIVTTATFELNGTSKQIELIKNNSEQQKPAIYENKIIWQDYSYGNWDIFMYDLGPDGIYNTSDDGNNGNITQITTNSYDQINASIWGDKIVYEDNRNYSSSKWDLYVYNLSTQTETLICNNQYFQINSDIYRDKIVWQDNRNGNWDIHMYNLTESKEIVINNKNSNQTEPSIYENRIAWADQRDENDGNGEDWDIYMSDLSHSAELYNGRDVKITSIDNGTKRSNPKIYGDKVIWEERKAIGITLYSYIYVYDFSKGKQTGGLTSWILGESDFYGDKIIWTSLDVNHQYLYIDDLSSNIEFKIDTNTNYMDYPAIYKDKIVWQHDWQNSNISLLDQFYTLDVSDDGDIDWNHTEVFIEPETTINFAKQINDYLSNATDGNGDGYIEIPLNLTSAYSGNFNISNINIYLEYLTDPLDYDTDGDLIYDGGEVYGFYGIDILEAEDAVDLKEWKNPIADLPSNKYEVPVVNFIYQTGVTLTGSLNHTFEDDDNNKVGEESRDSWITLRTHIDTTQQYKLTIMPVIVKTIFDVIRIYTEDGWITKYMEGGTVEYQEIAIYTNYTIYDYLRKVVANATYFEVERVGGGIIKPVEDSVVEYSNINKVITGTTLQGMPTNKASVMASMHYSGIYNFTQNTDYKITIGIDLTLIHDTLKPGSDECPDNLEWDEISLIRLVDLDNIRIERLALDPLSIDSDQDLLMDGFEYFTGGYPLNADADGDGLNDWIELIAEGTNPEYRDTDYDGIRDAVELGWTQENITITQGETNSPGSWTERIAHWDSPYDYTRINNYDADPSSTTDPFDADTDNDGLPDGWTDGWVYAPSVMSYPVNDKETNRNLGYWRYDCEFWEDSSDFDNLIQIYEGEDLNLDGDNEGITNWGFDPLVFNRTSAMSGESDATIKDTDGDGMPDGYEVWYSHLEPIYNETKNYILDPTNPNDGNGDYDPTELKQNYGNSGGSYQFLLNEDTVARAQRIDLNQTQDNISKIGVHINTSCKMRLEIWDFKMSSGIPVPKDCIFRQDSFEVSQEQDWYIFDIPDALLNISKPLTYFIVMRFMSENYSWYGKQNVGYNGSSFHQDANGDWTADNPGNNGHQLDFQLYTYDFEGSGDNLTNVNEYIVGTNPKNKNSDRIVINNKVFDDKLIDGDEVGFFTEWINESVIFRTNVKDGALKFDYYGKNNAYKEWIWFTGNGSNSKIYGFNQTLYDPPSYYSEVDDDNIRIDKLYDNTIIVFDTVEDMIYVWSPNANMEPDENGYCKGTCHKFSKDCVPKGFNYDSLPQVDYRNQERYVIDPCTYDTDRDNRTDSGNINFDDCEAPNWYDDPDDDGLVNAKDIDSDNDRVSDRDEIWKRYVNGNFINVGDIDKDGLAYCAIDFDSDGDNVSDGIEYNLMQGKLDADGDGWQNMIDPDLDGDGLPDGWIDGWEYNPYTMNGTINSSKINGAKNNGEYEDKDYDGKVDTGETNPMERDTDNDGLFDGYTIPEGALSLHPQLIDYYSWFKYYEPQDRVGELNVSTTNTDNDTDNDKLLDGQEIYGWIIYVEDMYVPPSDWELESQLGLKGKTSRHHITSDPNDYDKDTDDDGLTDFQEYPFYNASNNDTDNDGLTDYSEVNTHNSDPSDKDTDDDLLNDGSEISNNTSLFDPDCDDDGLYDGIEVHFNSNPNVNDTDNDGLTDLEEYQLILYCNATNDYNIDGDSNCNFNDTDSDGDGLNDSLDIEIDNILYSIQDFDGDGKPNGLDSDSDNDGALDGSDNDPINFSWDADNDGINNTFEDAPENQIFGLNSSKQDTDGDGVIDGKERFITDTDGDGYYNANDTDSDNDGLPDGWIDGWGFKNGTSGDNKSTPGWGLYYPTGDRNGDDDDKDPGEYEDSDLDSDVNDYISEQTNPVSNNTDGDHTNDGEGFLAGTDPTDNTEDLIGIIEDLREDASFSNISDIQYSIYILWEKDGDIKDQTIDEHSEWELRQEGEDLYVNQMVIVDIDDDNKPDTMITLTFILINNPTGSGFSDLEYGLRLYIRPVTSDYGNFLKDDEIAKADRIQIICTVDEIINEEHYDFEIGFEIKKDDNTKLTEDTIIEIAAVTPINNEERWDIITELTNLQEGYVFNLTTQRGYTKLNTILSSIKRVSYGPYSEIYKFMLTFKNLPEGTSLEWHLKDKEDNYWGERPNKVEFRYDENISNEEDNITLIITTPIEYYCHLIASSSGSLHWDMEVEEEMDTKDDIPILTVIQENVGLIRIERIPKDFDMIRSKSSHGRYGQMDVLEFEGNEMVNTKPPYPQEPYNQKYYEWIYFIPANTTSTLTLEKAHQSFNLKVIETELQGVEYKLTESMHPSNESLSIHLKQFDANSTTVVHLNETHLDEDHPTVGVYSDRFHIEREDYEYYKVYSYTSLDIDPGFTNTKRDILQYYIEEIDISYIDYDSKETISIKGGDIRGFSLVNIEIEKELTEKEDTDYDDELEIFAYFRDEKDSDDTYLNIEVNRSVDDEVTNILTIKAKHIEAFITLIYNDSENNYLGHENLIHLAADLHDGKDGYASMYSDKIKEKLDKVDGKKYEHLELDVEVTNHICSLFESGSKDKYKFLGGNDGFCLKGYVLSYYSKYMEDKVSKGYQTSLINVLEVFKENAGAHFGAIYGFFIGGLIGEIIGGLWLRGEVSKYKTDAPGEITIANSKTGDYI